MKKLTLTSQQSRTLKLGLIIGAIVIVILILIWQIARAVQPDTADTDPNSTDILPTLTQDQTYPDAYDESEENYLVDETQLATEVSALMAALGIDDGNTDVTGYNRDQIAAMDAQLPQREAAPVGGYRATRLYENGVAKDLTTLRAAGLDVTIYLGDDWTFSSDFLGIEILGTYDDRYAYVEHMNPMYIFWDADSSTFTVFAHALQVELTPDDTVTPILPLAKYD